MNVQHAEINLAQAKALLDKWTRYMKEAKPQEALRLARCVADQQAVVDFWVGELERRKKG